jgi:hypothetical protein
VVLQRENCIMLWISFAKSWALLLYFTADPVMLGGILPTGRQDEGILKNLRRVMWAWE